MSMTVSMPMAFIYAKSLSHSFSPQFWCGMSWEISSRKVPVILRPLSFGTMRVDPDGSAAFPPFPEVQDARMDGAATVAAPVAAMVLRKSLRFVISGIVISCCLCVSRTFTQI